jgi:hypothetical protein
MARVKQTAHKSSGVAPPCLHLATQAAQAAVQMAIAVRKPHRVIGHGFMAGNIAR